MPERFRDEDEEPIHGHEHDEETKPNLEPEPIKFGSQPVPIKCPFCLQQTKTEIIAKPELVSIVFGLVLFSALPNAIMIIVVVVTLQLTATKKHRCSLCERELGTDGKFLLVFTDEVYSLSLGETGLLISKKILVTGGLFLSIFLIIAVKGSIANRDLNWSQVSWQSYRNQCSLQNLNPSCLTNYQGLTIKNWKGYVMRVEDERQSMRRFYDHAVKIFVKMEPSEQPKHLPDLVLTGSSSIVYQFEEALDNMRHGDQIVFNATFKKAGQEKEVPEGRHLHIYDLNRTGLHHDSIEIYVKVEEEQWMSTRVEGQSLRSEEAGEQKIKQDLSKIVEQKKELQNPSVQQTVPREASSVPVGNEDIKEEIARGTGTGDSS